MELVAQRTMLVSVPRRRRNQTPDPNTPGTHRTEIPGHYIINDIIARLINDQLTNPRSVLMQLMNMNEVSAMYL